MRHLGTKQIETERLILRRFTVEDAPKMYENWASDDEVAKYVTWSAHANVEATTELLKMWVKGYEEENQYNWCMVLKENGEPIGNISVVAIKEQVQSMVIGYCIGRSYWQRGYTSEALQAVMNFLFDEVGVNRVEAAHDARNPHSGQVMKKCGMLYEGTRIEAGWNTSGLFDVVCYGLTKKQRNNLKEAAGTSGKGRNVISDETIEYVGILAKLELSEEERISAKKDMGDMLDYIDKLNELDTTGVEPMSHVFPVNNVFREDVVVNGDDSENMLRNAPQVKDQSYVVPKTVE